MTKELIISANVHEKKVGIIEDGVVTEFYVERRDENQGVVGNLYKGRVMKVLPGMQSAFVDIALDRDAFLYVSDFAEFMEDEDEIDFRDASAEHRSSNRPDDRSRRSDVQRPPLAAAAQTAQERSAEERSAEPQLAIEDVVEQLAEIADESVIAPPPSEEQLDAGLPDASASEGIEEAQIGMVDDLPTAAEVELAEETAGEEKPRRGRRKSSDKEDVKATRVTKRGEKADPDSSRRKAKPARRGSRRRTEGPAEEDETVVPKAAEESGSQFERVTDEDLQQEAGELLKDAILQEKFIDEVHSEEYYTPPVEPEPEWRVGSFKAQFEDSGAFQRVVDETADSVPNQELSSSRADQSSDDSELRPSQPAEERSLSPFRHIADFLPRGLFRRTQSETNDRADADRLELRSDNQDRAESVGQIDGDSEVDFSDADASIRDRGDRSEFAVRRGGRGRRRRRDPSQQGATGPLTLPVETEKAAEAGAVEASEVNATPEQVQPSEAQSVEARPAEIRPVESRPTEQRPRDQMRPARRPDGRHDRRPDQRRPEPPKRPERGSPATISELLHEGQEILVQIAKEPIAKKGARITSHIALPGRYLVYMPTVNHIGVSRKIATEMERIRLKRTVTALRDREGAGGGFIARTACGGHSEQELHDDMRYLLRTWADVRKKAERVKSPALVHRDLDLVQRILRDQLSEEYSAIRVDNEVEYARIVEFVNRVQPKLVNRVKLYTGNQPILEKYSVQPEIDKAVKPRVWLKSGGYIVINQTEALVAIDVNTGKFVGKSDRLEDTITRTNMEAAKEIVRQVRLRDLGGIIVIDFIDMEERKNRQRVMITLQQELQNDRAPSKILSINDFGLVAITRKRVKQSLERTLCTPCPYCQGAGMVKSPQTMCFEILEQAKAMSRQLSGSNDVLLRVSPDVAEALHTGESAVREEIEAHFGTPITIEADPHLHQEQFDFAIV
jgi:ribonuclease G